MAELTRRGALLGGAGTLGVAAAVATGGTSLAAGAPSAETPGTEYPVTAAMETLRRSDFTPSIGLVFTARAARAVAVRLVEIVDVAGATDPERSFNLIFETASATHPVEGVHRLSSDATPHRTLLLTPVDRHVAGGTRSFQALVNSAA